jgi:hypothetical protein
MDNSKLEHFQSQSNDSTQQELRYNQYGLSFQIGLTTMHGLNINILDGDKDTRIGFQASGGIYYKLIQKLKGSLNISYIAMPASVIEWGYQNNYSMLKFDFRLNYIFSPGSNWQSETYFGFIRADLKGNQNYHDFDGSKEKIIEFETSYANGIEAGLRLSKNIIGFTKIYFEISGDAIFMDGINVKSFLSAPNYQYPYNLFTIGLNSGLLIPLNISSNNSN